MAALTYPDAPAHPAYTSSMASHYFQDASFRPMTKSRNHPGSTGPYPLSQLYVKYIRRVWKRVSRATRKSERASMLPDGFVLINKARLSASARRKSVLLA